MRIGLVASLLSFSLWAGCSRAPHQAAATSSQELANECATALNAKEYNKAQRLAAEATRLDPQFAEGWVAYGMASVRLGKAELARQAYERALSLYQARHHNNPSDANPVSQQIFLLTLLGRSAEAQALLDQAHKSFPDDPQITKLVGHYSELRKDWMSLGVSTQ